ncbi:MAG: DUF4493 domain-containing protein [Bacteroidales bacterium]|nr:DUF4493 domain-containing protein [Bacteroidales bacterium]
MFVNKLLGGTTVAVAMLTLLSACNDTFDPAIASDKRGRLLVNVSLDKDIASPKDRAKAPASRTQADEISVEDLTLRLVSEDGSYDESWDTAEEMADSGEVPVGTYQFEVYYGEPEDEGFEKPYYYGEQTVTVMENQTSTVEVTATLADAMVSVSYSDAVLSYFSEIDGTVHTSLQNEFTYAPEEERPLYVTPGAVSVTVDVKKQNGVTATLSTDRIMAEARNHYHVNFDVNGGETGSPTLSVTFSSALDEEVVEIDLSDEILSAPAPEIHANGFENGELIMLVENVPVDNLTATIVGQAGIRSVVMTTSSTWLIGQGWPETVDLADLDEVTQALLTEYGLKIYGLDSPTSKIAQIDFGGVVEHVPYVEGMDNTTSFSLVATDRASHSSEEPFELKFEVENLALMVTDIEPIKQDETQLGFDVLYNASGFEKNVKVQVRNIRNTWDLVKPLSVVADADNSQLYHVIIPVSGDGDVVFKVLAGKDESEEYTAVRESLPAEVVENDVFARHAAVTLTGDAASASGATLMLSSDGGQSYVAVPATVSGKKLKFDGLEPGQTYMAKAYLDGLGSQPISFTTEQALQIPNGNLDDDVISHDSHRYEFVGWGTNNTMTSSQGGSSEYCRNSGSLQTTDAVSGKAALLRTTGWGSGNTNAGSWSIIKYVDPALLHLGAERSTRASDIYETSDLDCGIEFSSRPESMSFYYKYSAPNSGDTGEVLIRVIDKSGNTIVEKKQDLGMRDEYGEEKTTITLSYPENAPTCGWLYVRFLSSNKTPGNKNGSWLNYGNPHTGAELYIDEVELNY